MFWVCVCSFSCSACKIYPPECIVLCDMSGSTTRFDIRTISWEMGFSEKSEHRTCFLFSLQTVNETFQIRRRIQRTFITNVQKFPRKEPITPVRFWSNFPQQFSKNIKKCRCSWNSVRLEPSCSMRTDGYDEAKISSTFISYYNLCVKKIKVLEKTKKAYSKTTT